MTHASSIHHINNDTCSLWNTEQRKLHQCVSHSLTVVGVFVPVTCLSASISLWHHFCSRCLDGGSGLQSLTETNRAYVFIRNVADTMRRQAEKSAETLKENPQESSWALCFSACWCCCRERERETSVRFCLWRCSSNNTRTTERRSKVRVSPLSFLLRPQWLYPDRSTLVSYRMRVTDSVEIMYRNI